MKVTVSHHVNHWTQRAHGESDGGPSIEPLNTRGTRWKWRWATTWTQGSLVPTFQGAKASPPPWFFRGYFHSLFKNLEGITALSLRNWQHTHTHDWMTIICAWDRLIWSLFLLWCANAEFWKLVDVMTNLYFPSWMEVQTDSNRMYWEHLLFIHEVMQSLLIVCKSLTLGSYGFSS